MQDLQQEVTTVTNDNNLGAYGKSLKASLDSLTIELEAKQAEVTAKKQKWEQYQSAPDMFEDIYVAAEVNTKESAKIEKEAAKEIRVGRARTTRDKTKVWNAMSLAEQQNAITMKLPIAEGRKITAKG